MLLLKGMAFNIIYFQEHIKQHYEWQLEKNELFTKSLNVIQKTVLYEQYKRLRMRH